MNLKFVKLFQGDTTPEQAHRMKGELAKKWHPSKKHEMRKVQPKDKSIVN